MRAEPVSDQHPDQEHAALLILDSRLGLIVRPLAGSRLYQAITLWGLLWNELLSSENPIM